jgi:DNA-binding NarL/FixJ family response regulator
MGRKVIVAEDDPVMGSVIHATLEAVSHEVIAVVASGEEALTLAFSADPEVVVMDVNLAGKMNGIEAARRMRRRLGCRVVFHTAHTDPKHWESMAAIRNARVVTKPGDIGRLVEAVSTAR